MGNDPHADDGTNQSEAQGASRKVRETRDVPDSDFAGWPGTGHPADWNKTGYRISCNFLKPDLDIWLIA